MKHLKGAVITQNTYNVEVIETIHSYIYIINLHHTAPKNTINHYTHIMKETAKQTILTGTCDVNLKNYQHSYDKNTLISFMDQHNSVHIGS